MVFGVTLLFAPRYLTQVCAFWNKVIFSLDELLKPYKYVVGIIFIALAGWIALLAFRSSELGLLHPFWLVLLFFGLLYLFFPNFLDWLSKSAGKSVLQMDEFVVGAYKLYSIILILVSIYLFYSAYVVWISS
ncbi:MAG: hypothetical protein KKB81_05445 [Candidatus Margulisbacteria bacterium]|nr:hypothetical protein [Candidatus Margulisiibacteriota bacterium]MBU1021295.1 hypothetical protein [Candidatus Margulisiibacteriota bacterium]MBU1729216.1 hypothetical protein [Candidatus Margulisiibacteriota bacterium]MBU1954889.1 hypothetical protein [Candidatus Margulisiibacteriota bacterium]